jgi:hypothetical protein
VERNEEPAADIASTGKFLVFQLKTFAEAPSLVSGNELDHVLGA